MKKRQKLRVVVIPPFYAGKTFPNHKNELFNNLSDTELMERYFETCNEASSTIDPDSINLMKVTQVMLDRKLIYPGDNRESLMNRYQKVKKEEMIKELEEEGLTSKEATQKIDKELNRKYRICGCTFFNGCQEGCYWIEDDLCSSCRDAESIEEEEILELDNKRGIN